MNNFNCIKCGTLYKEKDAEPYLCEACNVERLRIAKEVDVKIASIPKKTPKSDFGTAQTLGRTINSASGGQATFIKASDLGINFSQ